jgi:geranylgeranylglycerol-phosphate geranylgeranyltransferase
MFRDWLKLARLPNAAVAAGGTWLGHACLPGPIAWRAAALGSLAMALLAAAGNMHNDVHDLAADRVNRPDRPLAAGRIAPRSALIAALCLFALALAAGSSLGASEGFLTASMGLLLWIYNARLKATPVWGNLAVALLCALSIYFPELGRRPDYTLMPALFAFFTTLAREVAKDAEDVAGDREQGASTLPIRFGMGAARALVACNCALVLLLLPVPFLRLGYHIGYPVAAAAGCLPLLALVLAGLRAPRPAWGLLQRRLKALMVVGMAAILLGVRV